MNSQGLYEYALYDKKTQSVEYVTDGLIKGREKTYEVHRDSTVIQLVQI